MTVIDFFLFSNSISNLKNLYNFECFKKVYRINITGQKGEIRENMIKGSSTWNRDNREDVAEFAYDTCPENKMPGDVKVP